MLYQTNPANAAADSANRYPRPPDEKPDINVDIQVKEDLGPWMIMVHAYIGPEAPIMARQMVTELRTNYKLPAYTFNYGAEERRKEYERVKAQVEQWKQHLAKNGMSTDQPIHLRTIRINEQVGVLIGGFANEAAAKKFLDERIRKLKPLDPAKTGVMLDKRVYYGEEKKDKAEKLQEGYVNPFLGAFVAHNPKVKQTRPADWDKPDIDLLRKLNSGESLSLLTCKKKYTLAVKDFPTPTMVETKGNSGSFIESFLGTKSAARVDIAATNAHSMGELLRQARLDAYVLHTKYGSYVCVGGFDATTDPAMRSMQTLLETKVMPQVYQSISAATNHPLTPSPVVPMLVPR